MPTATRAIDTEKYRLRRFVDRLVAIGEVEVHEEPVPLTGLGAIIEGTPKAVLFKRAGPERVEIVAKTADGSPPPSAPARRDFTTPISAVSPSRSRWSRCPQATPRSIRSSSLSI